MSSTGFQALALREKLDESLKLLAGLKFKGAELHVRNPEEIDVKATVALMAKYRMTCPTIGTGQAFFDEGLSLTDKDAVVRKKARKRLEAQLEFSAKLSCYITIGLIRGVPKKDDKEPALRMLADELGWLCERAAKVGSAGLVLEPLNRYETTIINTLSEAADIIRRVKADNLGILADSFHMNIEERNIGESITQAGKMIFHVHLADSNRWPPGSGHFNFKQFFTALEKIGYDDWASGEYMPMPNPKDSVTLFADFLKERGMLK